jgi:hypothetical protein
MKRDNSSDIKSPSESGNLERQRFKRSLSISELSRSFLENYVDDLDREEPNEDSGNKAPLKKQHRSLSITYSSAKEVDNENTGFNIGLSDFEAETIYKSFSEEELLQPFDDSPGPRAPLRQASKGSLIEEFGVDGEVEKSNSAEVALYFDQYQEKVANFLNDEAKEEASPSLSPRAKNSRIETFKVDSKMRE